MIIYKISASYRNIYCGFLLPGEIFYLKGSKTYFSPCRIEIQGENIFLRKKIFFFLQVGNPRRKIIFLKKYFSICWLEIHGEFFFFEKLIFCTEKIFLKQCQSNGSTNHGKWGVVLQPPKQM